MGLRVRVRAKIIEAFIFKWGPLTANGSKFIIVGTTQVFLTTHICPLTQQVFNCTQHI
jgi:hypothetical protein